MDETKDLDTDPRECPEVRFTRLVIKLAKSENDPGEEYVQRATLYGQITEEVDEKVICGHLLDVDTRDVLGLSPPIMGKRQCRRFSHVLSLTEFRACLCEQEEKDYLQWCSQQNTPVAGADSAC